MDDTDSWDAFAMLAECAHTMGGHGSSQGSNDSASRCSNRVLDDANYNRKDKSLGLLCDKFLQEYSLSSEVRINN